MIRAVFDYFGWWLPSGTRKRENRYENGQLRIQEFYQVGKLEGERKSWYTNGQLRTQEFYHNGKREGFWKAWYENGQLKEYKFFRENKSEGEYKSWYNSGFPRVRKFYRRGKLQGISRIGYGTGRSLFIYFRNDKHIGDLTRTGIKNIIHIRQRFQNDIENIDYFLIPDLVRMI